MCVLFLLQLLSYVECYSYLIDFKLSSGALGFSCLVFCTGVVGSEAMTMT